MDESEKPSDPPSMDKAVDIRERAKQFLIQVTADVSWLQQVNIERRNDGWRLRIRRRNPETGRTTRRAIALPGTPEEAEAMARILRPALSALTQSRRHHRATWRDVEAEARICRTAMRRLRAQVVTGGAGSERRRRALGLAFDAAVLVGPPAMEWLLRKGTENFDRLAARRIMQADDSSSSLS